MRNIRKSVKVRVASDIKATKNYAQMTEKSTVCEIIFIHTINKELCAGLAKGLSRNITKNSKTLKIT